MENITSQDCGNCAVYQDEIYQGLHESEIALDQEERWDYVIDNSYDLENLVIKVREILAKEGIF